MKVVGQELPRVEVLEKVTGQSVFGADAAPGGRVLYGKMVLSPHAHARITAIRTERAERLPGVKAVVTAADVPPIRYGRFVGDEEYFASARVRYAGDRIAAVAAVDEETAEEAARLIEVDYEVLPAVTSGPEAMAPDAPLIHEGYADYFAQAGVGDRHGNVCGHKRIVRGDVEQGFAQSDRIFEHRFHAPMVHQTYIEPHTALARFDASGKATVWVPTQAQFPLRAAIAQILRMPMTRVRVIPTEIGGGFGGKIHPTIEPAAVALARKARRPVRIVMSRSEDFQTTNPRHPFHLRYKTGVKLDGAIMAREIELVLGTGYSAGSGVMISQGAAVRAPGPYRIPHLKIDSYCVYTNTPTCGAYRGPAGPQLTFASESQIDIMAHELGIDPLEMRLRNAMENGDETPAGARLEDVHARETLLKAAEVMSAAPKAPGDHTGRGMAVAHWLVGGMASSAGVKLNEDGTIAILTGVVDLSGASTSLAQIAAEVLGVSLEDVHVRTADTDFAPHSTISAGSQALKSMGSAVLLAAREVKRQIQQVAADALEADPGDLDLDDGKVFVKGSPERTVSFRKVGHLALEHERGPIVSTQSVSRLTPHPAMAAHAAEVAVDPDTGHVRILRYVAVQDVGTAVNPLSVRGQVEGGVMQGLGQALSEACTFTDGKMNNPNLLDYKIFSALDAPTVEVHLIQHPCASGPLGAKGVGEPPIIPPPAVMANAVFDAVGVRIHDLPLTPERIVKALKDKRAQHP